MKQLEKAGIPATHICTVTPISKTVGAARIFGAEANAIVSTGTSIATILLPQRDRVLGELQEVERVTGDPNLPPEKELNRRREIVMGALNLLTEGGGSVSGESNAVFTD